MQYLLDTTAFSDAMRNHAPIIHRLSSLPASDAVIICPIVRGEILHGIERLPPGKRRDALLNRATGLFDRLDCLPLPEDAADHYARVKYQCESLGRPLDDNDLWIAACALAWDATVVTSDTDLLDLDGARSVDWSM